MKRKSKRTSATSGRAFGKTSFSPTKLRIVSGEYRGRKIRYNGDPKTRPMKERTREAVFSLLGGKLSGYWCLDLFGGTGILAFETVSRGAAGGLILELSNTAFRSILENMQELQFGERLQVKLADTLRWMKDPSQHMGEWPELPWVVFCCPPYAMWTRETEKMTAGLRTLYQLAPAGSKFVCETDKEFDVAANLPELSWDVRQYPPAIISLTVKPVSASEP